MRSCLQCRAVTCRQGGIWNLHSLLYSHGHSFDDPAHKTRWSKERDLLPFLFFLLLFLIFSLVASAVPFPENVASNHKQQLQGKDRSAWWASIRNSLLSPLVGFHLTSRFWGFVLTSFHSVPISGPLFRTRSKQDFLCTRYHETRLHTL